MPGPFAWCIPHQMCGRQLSRTIAKRQRKASASNHLISLKLIHRKALSNLAPFLLLFGSRMAGYVVHAPASLGRETRGIFRRQTLEALEALEAAGESSPLLIDLSATRIVDSAGLGVLVLLQRRAAEVQRPVQLRGASDELRFLLVMTRLEDRFIFVGAF
jgi:anti-anti-sigma regulatory factor